MIDIVSSFLCSDQGSSPTQPEELSHCQCVNLRSYFPRLLLVSDGGMSLNFDFKRRIDRQRTLND